MPIKIHQNLGNLGMGPVLTTLTTAPPGQNKSPSVEILPQEPQINSTTNGGAVDGRDGNLGEFDHLLRIKKWDNKNGSEQMEVR